MASAPRDHLIFYDQDCGFCRRMLRIVLTLDDAADGRLVAVELQDPRAAGELQPMDEPTRMASWHLKRPDGRVFSEGDALPELLSVIGRYGRIETLLRRYPRATNRGYRWIADHRTLFGRVTRRLPDIS
jgi:predicted DCC family thiol-disulfide oxidoreductase YuxK